MKLIPVCNRIARVDVEMSGTPREAEPSLPGVVAFESRRTAHGRVDSPRCTVYRPARPVTRNDPMRILALFALLAVSGCSTAPDIVKLDGDMYRVRPDAGGGSPSEAEIKARGIKRANEFCDAQGKRAVIIIGQTSGWFVFGLQTAEVQFYCDEQLAARPSDKTTKP